MKKIHNILRKQLPDIRKKLPIVNHGGCGIVALELHKVLNKVGIDNQIICLMLPHNYTAINEYRNGELQYPSTACQHAVVKVGSVYYDGYGKANVDFYDDCIKMRITQKEMTYMLKYGVWNRRFDREVGFPIIKNQIKKLSRLLN